METGKGNWKLISFLWKYSNGQVKAFKATGKNDYYILSEWHCLAFGGG
jgi:hypothetical protein